ncbi:DUF6231 family protein [Thiobacillus sedimenti]|uniref:DUF6231 family protein n=1 Tax=Thiobacillus sedimenti TaxID=3110231 RepID=A0ABZ1CHH0_9PROT|nr:DUF6231 family protein [Thiobacillus sp. SCUT-2]WRS38525.1 DUF6231 family protein [Thiobacillus sp. SCUT-2]
MTWREHLEARLQASRPARVCALDAAARALAAVALPGVAIDDAATAPAPCALALGVDALDGLDAAQAEQLLSRVRLYTAPHVLVVARPGCALDEAAFRALGFTLAATDAAGVRVHEYDIETYKSVPDWLNSRFWAHPERWEP